MMTQQQFSNKVQELIDEDGMSVAAAIEWAAAEQAYDELGR